MYSYSSSIAVLLISSLYIAIPDIIAITIKVLLNIESLLTFLSHLFYNTHLHNLDYNIPYTFKYNILLLDTKKAPPTRCLFVIVYWRDLYFINLNCRIQMVYHSS